MHQLAGYKERHPHWDKIAHLGVWLIWPALVFSVAYLVQFLVLFYGFGLFVGSGIRFATAPSALAMGELLQRLFLGEIPWKSLLILPAFTALITLVKPNTFRDLFKNGL
ncbi:MAG: hypothetical protein COA73_15685 [Candidatus Hydrogenedentota bacterium]|nr:MAG: hypothetical protein COA73_17540 [Candidatus Hydrogenedentota bacterium]PCJ52986.1 MAG: hypothetical protein COA73_15685 [Candidatus Hydrogenedentota bacterium]